jgi:hypothetical protein
MASFITRGDMLDMSVSDTEFADAMRGGYDLSVPETMQSRGDGQGISCDIARCPA